MTVFPVLLDARPSYLGVGGSSSLLLAPVGRSTLLDEFRSALADIRVGRPFVVPRFESNAEYIKGVRQSCPSAEVLADDDALQRWLTRLEPSDTLLLIDTTRYPMDGPDLRPIMQGFGDGMPLVRHLLALEGSPEGTRELVQTDASGQVRRIQRYYERATWTFAAGIAATLMPVSAMMTARDQLPLTSLPDLRRTLAGAGIPSQDVPTVTGAFDLSDLNGLLAISERAVVDLVSTSTSGRDRGAGAAMRQYRAESCSIHPTARLIGAVAVLDGATIESGALVVGPTTVAANARVGSDAVVAQCVIMPGATVPAATTVRHAVVPIEPIEAAQSPNRQRRHVSGMHSARPTQETGDSQSSYATVKRLIDILVAGGLLLVLSPLMLLIAVLVKLDSRGPLLHGGVREGRGGKPFRCWKFRSMIVDAEAKQRELVAENHVDGPQFKIDDDPRVTRLGRWLRRANLDELPQLLNVLVGEMSLVGPRPSPFRENQVCVPWRQGRLSARPGITGLWQVCRHDRAQGDFHQWIQYDLLYVKNASLLVDIKIFIATLITLGGRRPVALGRIIPEAVWSHGDGTESESRQLPASPRLSQVHNGALGAAIIAALLVTAINDASAQEIRASRFDRRGNVWLTGFSVQQEWVGNYLLVRPDDPADLVSRVGATVGRVWDGRRGKFSVAMDGDAVRFADQTYLNSFVYRARADFSRSLSRRVGWRLGYVSQTSPFREFASPSEAFRLPQVTSHVNSGAGSIDYRVSDATTMRVETNYDGVTFDSPQLWNGWSAAERLSLVRRASAGSRIGLNYEFVRSSTKDNEAAKHSVHGTWAGQLGRHTKLDASVGATRVQMLGTGEWEIQPTGTAEMRFQSQHSILIARYDRYANQVFGLGRIMSTDHVSATLEHPFGQRLTFIGISGYSWSHDHGNANSGGIGYGTHEARFRFVVTPRVAVTAGAFLRQRDELTRISSRGLVISVAHGERIP